MGNNFDVGQNFNNSVCRYYFYLIFEDFIRLFVSRKKYIRNGNTHKLLDMLNYILHKKYFSVFHSYEYHNKYSHIYLNRSIL